MKSSIIELINQQADSQYAFLFNSGEESKLTYHDFKQLITEYSKSFESDDHLNSQIIILEWRPETPLQYFYAFTIACINTKKTCILVDFSLSPEILDKTLSQLPDSPQIALSFDGSYRVTKNFETNLNTTNLPTSSLVIMTSGSSGTPKGVVLCESAILNSATSTIEFYKKEMKLTTLRDLIWAQTLPPVHIGGFMIGVRALIEGMSIWVQTQNSWKNFFSYTNPPRPTIMSLVPAQLYTLLNDSEKKELLINWHKNENLRLILMGGAKADKQLIKKAIEYNLPIALSYGQSEMCAQITSTSIYNQSQFLNDSDFINQFSGQLLQGKELEIDPSSKLIKVKGNSLFSGYIIDQKYSLIETDSNGFFQTSDMGEISQGNLHVLGRKDKIIISGGKNVSLKEVENYIKGKLKKHQLDKKLLIHLFCLPDLKFGDTVGLCFSIKDEQNVNAKTSWSEAYFYEKVLSEVTKNMPAHMRPKLIFPIKRPPLNLKGLPLWAKEDIQVQSKTHQKIINALKNTPLNIEYFNGLNKKAPSDSIIFIHGMMGSAKEYFDLSDHLTIRNSTGLNIDFYSIDLPGHGQSEIDQQDFNQISRDLAKSIKTIMHSSQARKVHLFGYSMGGRVLMQTLIDYPELATDKIGVTFFESCSPGLESLEEKEKRATSDSLLFEDLNNKQDWQEFYSNWYRLPLFGNVWKQEIIKNQLLTRLYRELTKHNSQELKQRWQTAINIMSVSKQKNLWPSLSKLPRPVYFLYGENDIKYASIALRSTTKIYEDLTKNGMYGIEEISKQVKSKGFNSAHMPHIETPEDLSDFILSIVSQV